MPSFILILFGSAHSAALLTLCLIPLPVQRIDFVVVANNKRLRASNGYNYVMSRAIFFDLKKYIFDFILAKF